jgi:hypothetical protein
VVLGVLSYQELEMLMKIENEKACRSIFLSAYMKKRACFQHALG